MVKLKEKKTKLRESTTLRVWWNLIGHEGNISSVAAGFPVVNKAAKHTHKKKKKHEKVKTQSWELPE